MLRKFNEIDNLKIREMDSLFKDEKNEPKRDFTLFTIGYASSALQKLEDKYSEQNIEFAQEKISIATEKVNILERVYSDFRKGN